MLSSTSKTPPCFIKLTTKLTSPNPRWIQLTPRKENQRKTSFKSLKCVHNPETNLKSSSSSLIPSLQNPNSLFSGSSVTGTSAETSDVTPQKLQFLVSEFKSLSEPIDRVKRLLHYAALLPPFDESARVEANRVNGCTAQVWLEARMDSNGLLRFRADSDSEISKGFSSCLIWVLDGAAPEEVLAVKAEDLADMNVGFAGRAHSRVNTWHNVLMSMHKRTKALVEERQGQPSPKPFPSLVVTIDDITGNGTYAKAQKRLCSPDLNQMGSEETYLTDDLGLHHIL